MGNWETLIQQFGLPAVFLAGILMLIAKAGRVVWKTFSPYGKAWFEQQSKLTDKLEKHSDSQTEILGDLRSFATHGHRALKHALSGLDEIASGNPGDAAPHLERARNQLLDKEDEE